MVLLEPDTDNNISNLDGTSGGIKYPPTLSDGILVLLRKMSHEKSRKAAEGRLNNLLDQINNHTAVPLTSPASERLHVEAARMYEKAERATDALVALCVDDNAIQVQTNALDNIYSIYCEILSKLDTIRATFPPLHTTSTAPAPPPAVRLPAIDPPTFSGNHLEWMSFRDLFYAAVHNQSSLSGAQKLQYLKQSVKGPPATLIRDFPITDGNYTEAWDLLENRYNNLWDIISTTIRKLLHLKQITHSNNQQLSTLLDSTTECVRALTVHNVPVDQWDTILIVLTLDKLDDHTRQKWAEVHNASTLPTFKEFTSFLEVRIRALQATRRPPSEKKPDNQPRQQRHVLHVADSGARCSFCPDQHFHYRCPVFLAKSPADRKKLVDHHRLCPNCLRVGHKLQDCRSKSTCWKCKQRHHTQLHQEPAQNVQADAQRLAAPSTSSLHAQTNTQVLLSTAVVNITSASGTLHPCRVLLDSGSQASFISEECAQRLGLRRQWSSLTVSGISDANVTTTKGKVTIDMFPLHPGAQRLQQVDCHILPKVTKPLPKYECDPSMWSHLKGLNLADPTYHHPGNIDILLGEDYRPLAMLGGKIDGPPNTPTAENTIFGWVVSGKVEMPDLHNDSHCALNVQCASTTNPTPVIHSLHINSELEILKRFWEIEEPPKARFLTTDERYCEQHFLSTHTRTPEGRFEVSIPFNSKKADIGESRSTAIRRLKSVENRLCKNPTLYSQYRDFMNEYKELGHMQPVSEPTDQPTYYLPHHAVVNEGSTTTKLRVVFDASAKSSSGISFNDAVHIGATVQDNLYDHLLRFLLYPVVLKADIPKMYRQILISTAAKPYHRIVWRNSPNEPIQDYELQTVTYGTAPAPNLATRCLMELGHNVHQTHPAASAALLNSFYVDDLLVSLKDTSTAVQLYHQITQALQTASMGIKKWASNDPEVLKIIPAEDKELATLDFDDQTNIKTLGVQWNPVTDTFSFKLIQDAQCVQLTKRTLLSELGRVFDPLGLITPVTVRAKLILQELWKCGTDWDTNVPDFIQTLWSDYKSDLKQLPAFQLRRCINPHCTTTVQLHGFSDASEKAYGVVVYLRTGDPDQPGDVYFITSKSKVTPLRQITLPRLELMAAVMLVDLITHVKEVLGLDCPKYLWTDSSITLAWIKASPRRWHTFVANRVARIQESTIADEWHHIPGTDNPADLTSRGSTPNELFGTNLWRDGPSWLSQPKSLWPAQRLPHQPIPAQLLEERATSDTPVTMHALDIPNAQPGATDQFYSTFLRFSSLIKLKRVYARVLRLVRPAIGPLTPTELHHSLTFIIGVVQGQHFSEEIACLKKGNEVKPKSKLRQLVPFIDRDGILRVTGRLHNAQRLDHRKHQAILPSDSHFTSLLIRHLHLGNLHSGFQLTWSTLQSDYWIIGGRDKVRHQLRSCITCKRWKAEAAQHLMGSLPSARVSESYPFLHSGVDYAGAFILKNAIGRAPKTYKGYLCIFVCMATKAVHLEAVTSLSTTAFIATLRRFISRRGLCTDLYSDCGTNFVGAEKELQRFIRDPSNTDIISDNLSNSGIRFHFNPPSAPNHGGLWEAGVKSAKYHLRRVMGNRPMTYEQFSTTLCQIEAAMNSRPMYPASPDPADLTPLTPGHFLIGRPLIAIPEPCLLPVPVNRLTMFQQQQLQVQQFWKRWHLEYLNTLQQRLKWYWEQPSLTTGDLVLIVEESNPGTWKMGRIVELHPGDDGRVRVVTVKTAQTSFKRPVSKLIPLLKHNDYS